MSYAKYSGLGGGGGGGGIPTYSTFTALPVTDTDGAAAITLDTDTLYIFNLGSVTWLPVAKPGDALAIGVFDAGSPSANGAHIDVNALTMQSASATVPGLVNLGAQTFEGTKTFNKPITVYSDTGTNITESWIGPGSSGYEHWDWKTSASTLILRNTGLFVNTLVMDNTGATAFGSFNSDLATVDVFGFANKKALTLFNNATTPGDLLTGFASDQTTVLAKIDSSGNISGNNLSGTNSGNVTLAAVGSSGNANGASLSGQAITLQPASASFPGVLTATDWSTFNGKQAAGNYITALTGDVTASGPGSVASTIAANAVTNAKAAQMATLTMKGNNTGGTANSIDLTVAQVTSMIGVTTSTASSLAERDANKNIAANNFISDYTTTATAAGTTTLTVGSTFQQFFTGVTTQTVVLPVASTLTLGHTFFILNNSSGVVTVNSSGANLVQTMAGGSQLEVTCILTSGTTAASWQIFYTASITGTVPIAAGGTGQITKASAFDALQPMTTGGDIIYGGASGTATRLVNGSLGQVFTSGGGTAAPTWSAVPYGNQAVASKTTTYAILTTDNLVLCSGSAFTVTLPTAVGVTGKQYTIKKTDAPLSNQITIATTSSQTIDGVTTRKLSTQYEQFTLVSDGANWAVASHTFPSGWAPYTPTITGFGTPSAIAFLSRRSGDSLQIQGVFTSGTVTASAATFTIGFDGVNASVTTDSSVLSASLIGQAGYSTNNTVLFEGGVLANPNLTTLAFSRNSSTTSVLSAANGNAIAGTGVAVSLNATVKISGWEG